MSNFNSLKAFTILTDAWYNNLLEKLNLSKSNFQLVQPLPFPNDNQNLWNNFNNVPPVTLKYNHYYYNQPDFFGQYAMVIEQLLFPESKFINDIGADNYANWQNYLAKQPSIPPANQLPTLFMKWAMFNAPDVANIGSSDLSQQVLIQSGQAALNAYQGPNAELVDFQPSVAILTEMLKNSPSVSFSFDSSKDNPDVSNSWVSGFDPNFFGLWTGSWSVFNISYKFAKSVISVTVNFDHFSVVPITPGSWYNSGLLHLALVSKSAPPWVADPDLNWNKFFGETGEFKYAIGSVLVADGISLTLQSDAVFTSEEQSVIQKHSEMGFWPLYCGQKKGVVSNNVTFDSGKLMINTKSIVGNPAIIGNNVFSINQYLGGN